MGQTNCFTSSLYNFHFVVYCFGWLYYFHSFVFFHGHTNLLGTLQEIQKSIKFIFGLNWTNLTPQQQDLPTIVFLVFEISHWRVNQKMIILFFLWKLREILE
jgi:hypothetical protein